MTGSRSAGLSSFDEVTVTSPGMSKSGPGAGEETNFMVGRFRLLVASPDFGTLACSPYMHNLAMVECMRWRR